MPFGLLLIMEKELIQVLPFIGLIPAFIARNKGKNFVIWWAYGAMLFIVALLHALLIRPDNQKGEKEQRSERMKKCFYCAESIKGEAKVFQYCGQLLHD